MYPQILAYGTAGVQSSCGPSAQQTTIVLHDQQHPDDVSPFATSQKDQHAGWSKGTSSLAAPDAFSNSSRPKTPPHVVLPAQQQAPMVAGLPAFPSDYPPVFLSQLHAHQHAINMPATPSKDSLEQSDPYACACSGGWALFGLGWILPVCWIVSICFPLCSHNRNDRRAAIASALMLVVYASIIAVLITTSPNGSWYAHASGYSHPAMPMVSPKP